MQKGHLDCCCRVDPGGSLEFGCGAFLGDHNMQKFVMWDPCLD